MFVQSQTCEDLYTNVTQLEDTTQSLCIRDAAGVEIPKAKVDLHEYLYDGALLMSEYTPYMSLIVHGAGTHHIFTIHVPVVCGKYHVLLLPTIIVDH